ncbi:MAG: ATP-dependent Clp protease ATP-binding subunit [Patescibacteria group bacterium]|nr:ATP-dependent Clp protease ATP-binding subunit [Patescibacteria group bacterium]
MPNNEENLKFLSCGQCGGLGVYNGKKCHLCMSRGIVAYLDGYILYWGEKIDSGFLALYKVERFITKAVYVILFALALLGILSLVSAVYSVGYLNILSLIFWESRSVYLLYFWLSLLVDFYLIYYFSLGRESRDKIKPKKFKESKEAFGPLILDWSEIAKMNKRFLIDVSKSMSEEAMSVVEKSFELARKYRAKEVQPIHFLIACLVVSDEAQKMFVRLGVDFPALSQKLGAVASAEAHEQGQAIFSPNSEKVLLRSYRRAYFYGGAEVSVRDIAVEAIFADQLIADALSDLNVTAQKVENVSLWFAMNKELKKQWFIYRASSRLKSKAGIDRAMTALQTPLLNRFSEDLTRLAKMAYLPLCVDREKEFNSIFQVLEGSSQKGIILVGEAGVGKTAMIEGLAQRMIADDVPKFLADKRLVSLSVSRILAGASLSQAQERMYLCLNQIIRARNVVLFIDNIHELVPELIEILAEAISKNLFICLASTNPLDYKRVIEPTGLGHFLKKIQINEPEENVAIQILEGRVGYVEAKNNVFFSYDAIEQAVKLTDRYEHDQFLPFKALNLIEEAGVWAKNNKGANAMVTGNDVATLISDKLGVKAAEITQSEGERLERLEQVIHERIVGQAEAVNAVANSLRRARAELREVNRPIANLLFLGPTGTGKTELAKTIAEVYFGNEDNMIRLDMSEYQEQSGLNRLIGAPPGYEGAASGGQLTEAVRQKPFSIVLLDELEKAHPDILNLFLQVMEDGRLTDASGKTIDFTNVILIATSNAQTSFIQEKIKEGVSLEEIKKELLESELKKYFKPEFINRFDNIIVFKPLDIDDVKQVARLMLAKVAKQLEAKGINFSVTEVGISELARAGFDPQYGARPLRRAISEKVDNALASYLIAGKIGKRDNVIYDQGGIIRVEKAREI